MWKQTRVNNFRGPRQLEKVHKSMAVKKAFRKRVPFSKSMYLSRLLSFRIMYLLRVTRRNHHRPGIAPNANTTHVPTAGSSAAPTKPNHTPSRHSRAKGKLLLQSVTPHAAGSRRTHVSRTQECARTRPVTDVRPPSTCTHRTSQTAEVADATKIRTPPASCQLTGPMAPLPIKWSFLRVTP